MLSGTVNRRGPKPATGAVQPLAPGVKQPVNLIPHGRHTCRPLTHYLAALDFVARRKSRSRRIQLS